MRSSIIAAAVVTALFGNGLAHATGTSQPCTSCGGHQSPGGTPSSADADANAASTARSIADAVAQGNAELAAQLLNQSSNRNEVLTALQSMNLVNTNVLGALREVSASGGNSSSMTNLRNAVQAYGGNANAQANGGTGSGVGTVTVGNNTYYPTIPVNGAAVSAANTILPGGGITTVRSGCVGKVNITDKRVLSATRGTIAGLFSWGYDNGFEQTTSAKTGPEGKLTYGEWNIVGYNEKGQLVQERDVIGFEYVMFAYLVGGGASNGVVRNGVENAVGVNGNQANTSFGTSIMEFGCSFQQTRLLLTPPKDPPQTVTIELTALAEAQVLSVPGVVRPTPGGKRDPNVCYRLDNGVVIFANGKTCSESLKDYMGKLPKPNAGAKATYVVKAPDGSVIATRTVEGTPGNPGSAVDQVIVPVDKKK